jgi:hypothetical protein
VLRVLILEELVTRPWDASREPVTANLTIHAPLFGAFGDDVPEPAAAPQHDRAPDPDRRPTTGRVRWLGGAGADPEHTVPAVNGQPITAGALRDLLHRLNSLCPGGLQAPTGGRLLVALHDPDTGKLRAVVTRAELERLARRGCPMHTGGADCDCAILDMPPPVDRYEATPAQRRFLTTRDRTCRHPGCSNRAGWADLDHQIPHDEGGETCCTNLCCLCRRHHRIKTHAPGWLYAMADDGVLVVTTPSGLTRISRPPGLIDPAYDPAPF